MPMGEARRSNGAAVAALVMGILLCVPVITGLGGIILGMVGIKTAQDPRAEMFSGQIREMTIGGEETRIVLSRISRRYYLLLLLGGEGILGQGRYELARAAAALEKELV